MLKLFAIVQLCEASVATHFVQIKWSANCWNQIDEDNAAMESHQSLQAGTWEKLISFHTMVNLKDWSSVQSLVQDIVLKV